MAFTTVLLKNTRRDIYNKIIDEILNDDNIKRRFGSISLVFI
jgi:hypothetical protein